MIANAVSVALQREQETGSSIGSIPLTTASSTGNARLSAACRYAPSSSNRWMVSPDRRLRGRLGVLASGTSIHTSGNPRLVLRQLAPARVGGVVHLQHHVREVVLAERHVDGD